MVYINYLPTCRGVMFWHTGAFLPNTIHHSASHHVDPSCKSYTEVIAICQCCYGYVILLLNYLEQKKFKKPNAIEVTQSECQGQPQLNFCQASLLVSVDQIIYNVSENKSKWHVTIDGNVHHNGYILFQHTCEPENHQLCRKAQVSTSVLDTVETPQMTDLYMQLFCVTVGKMQLLATECQRTKGWNLAFLLKIEFLINFVVANFVNVVDQAFSYVTHVSGSVSVTLVDFLVTAQDGCFLQGSRSAHRSVNYCSHLGLFCIYSTVKPP